MIHGGNHNQVRFFITALPLTARDPVLTRNWIKFFAAHGIRGLGRVNANFNDPAKTIRFLKTSLAHPEKVQSILGQFGLKIKNSGLRTSSLESMSISTLHLTCSENLLVVLFWELE